METVYFCFDSDFESIAATLMIHIFSSYGLNKTLAEPLRKVSENESDINSHEIDVLEAKGSAKKNLV